MKAIAELLNAVIVIINKILARQEQKQHEATVDEIQSNPGEFLAGHFGGVPDAPGDPPDKADTRRAGSD